MILTIDTINKTITVNESVSVEELIQLIGDHYIFRQYTLMFNTANDNHSKYCNDAQLTPVEPVTDSYYNCFGIWEQEVV